MFKTLRNTGTADQWVILEGTKYFIKGNSEENYEDKIADKFLEIHSPVIMDMAIKTAGGQTYAPDLIQDTVWIANITGNPDSRPEVEVSRYDKSLFRVAKAKIKNINHEPRPYIEELKGGHQQWQDSAGLVQRSLPSKWLNVPPYSRRPFAASEARWLLQRDSLNEQRGAIIESRPPSDFEPDMTWKLKDMRAYGRLVDENMDLGIDDMMLAKKANEEKWDDKKGAEELRRTKQLMLRRLYFRLVDPSYRLPTRKEFTEFVTGKSEEQIAKEELNELMSQAEKDVKKPVAPTIGSQRKVG